MATISSTSRLHRRTVNGKLGCLCCIDQALSLSFLCCRRVTLTTHSKVLSSLLDSQAVDTVVSGRILCHTMLRIRPHSSSNAGEHQPSRWIQLAPEDNVRSGRQALRNSDPPKQPLVAQGALTNSLQCRGPNKRKKVGDWLL